MTEAAARCPDCGAFDPMGDEAAWHKAGCIMNALVCKHCGERLRRRDTMLGGRYRYERANTPDTAIFGSGSECANSERGHEVEGE